MIDAVEITKTNEENNKNDLQQMITEQYTGY